jgi:alcohol dehydrogenase, propanol-preferring
VAVGEGVHPFKEGDRAGIAWLYSACGECEWCITGWETLCPAAQYGGSSVNGGFAEYFVPDARYAAHIPSRLAPAAAAPLLCAGIATYKGLKETEVRPGQWVVIMGVGGLGHLAIQYAKAMGLQVAAVDVLDEKLELAHNLGVSLRINSARQNPVTVIEKEIGGAQGVLITAPLLPAFRQGVGMTRRRGTCVLVGLPPGELVLPIFDIVLKRITVRGSLVGTRADMQEALSLASSFGIAAGVEMQPLRNINEVFNRLRRAKCMVAWCSIWSARPRRSQRRSWWHRAVRRLRKDRRTTWGSNCIESERRRSHETVVSGSDTRWFRFGNRPADQRHLLS